jgi:hypothetical protein
LTDIEGADAGASVKDITMSLVAPDHAMHDEDFAPALIFQQQSSSSCRDSRPAVKRKAVAMGMRYAGAGKLSTLRLD